MRDSITASFGIALVMAGQSVYVARALLAVAGSRGPLPGASCPPGPQPRRAAAREMPTAFLRDAARVLRMFALLLLDNRLGMQLSIARKAVQSSLTK
jgi:hypothetical protein